ncbi:MAG TPA: undecaprenyl diphosphate synthase family protein [Methanoregulaceae archaeon]|nr:undecaprenyl diphosphate synthase family protein [Methanoregulaceae archaeon]
MIYWLYEKALLRKISVLPAHICFMITERDVKEAPMRMYEVTGWCREISNSVRERMVHEAGIDAITGITSITFHISTRDPSRMEPYLPDIRKIAQIARLNIHIGQADEQYGKGMDVLVAIGKSGRDEIVDCLRKMAREHIRAEEVTEQVIEEHLTFQYTPDLVIKTGGDHLTDFLIWQAVYSELFFSDVNWKWFRKVDFLRALRDYQSRARRFGR